MPAKFYTIFVGILVTVTACTIAGRTPLFSFGHDAPASPEFVSRVFISEISGRDLCIELDLETVWRTGDYIPETSDSVFETMKVSLNGLQLEDFWIEIRDIPYEVYDAQNELIGSYGGPLAVCLDVSGLSLGSHIAAIEFLNTADEVYNYSIRFEIVPTEDSKELTIILPQE